MNVELLAGYSAAHALAAVVKICVFIGVVSLVTESWRHRAMVVMLAVAGGAYIDKGLGDFIELPGTLVVAGFALASTKRIEWLGVGWLIHTALDVAHHQHGRPWLTSDPMSSADCAFADVVLAIWFFVGAPSIWQLLRRRPLSSSSVEVASGNRR